MNSAAMIHPNETPSLDARDHTISRHSRIAYFRILILLSGLIVPQLVLIGPSLIGRKIFLAVDGLAQKEVYLPLVDGKPVVATQDVTFSDPVLQFEPFRWFAAEELRAGRIPLWNPYGYCGAPFLAANQPAIFSPTRLLDYIWTSPAELAWRQVLKTLIAGIGAYFFFRRAVRVKFAAAAIGAWCWPLTGFFILWAGHPQSEEAIWLPWAMWAVDSALRRPAGLGGIGVAFSTACLLVSGHSATGAQILLGCGVYAIWRLLDLHGPAKLFTRPAARSTAAVLAGWIVGFLLASPQMLPTLEYLHGSNRIATRIAGHTDTPAMGLSALAQLFAPYFYGSTNSATVYLLPGARQEGAAAGCVGVIVSLFLAPLALTSRRHRSLVLFCVAGAFVGMAQLLGVPILARILQSPPLNILRNNRLALLSGWAILTAAVVGCNQLLRSRATWKARPIMAAPAACLGASCLFLAIFPPVAVKALPDVLGWFRAMYIGTGAICAFALLLWGILLWTQGNRAKHGSIAKPNNGNGRRSLRYSEEPDRMSRNPALRSTSETGVTVLRQSLAWAAGIMALIELTILGYNVYPQCDPALYYPKIAILDALAKAPPGRICGVHCLPPRLSERYKLSDIRGYDGADPARLVQLLDLFREKNSDLWPDYAVTQWYQPHIPSPLADMLNLRYLIYRGAPPAGVKAALAGDDYYVVENAHCLPRVLVPRRTTVVNDAATSLKLLSDPAFDARAVAYVESPTSIGDDTAVGDARIVGEDPTHVSIDVDMRTAGTVVLADLWDPGWKAFLNGAELPVLRADHALRAVRLPSCTGRLEFRYEPRSFAIGVGLFSIGMLLCGIWAAANGRFTAGTPWPRRKIHVRDTRQNLL